MKKGVILSLLILMMSIFVTSSLPLPQVQAITHTFLDDWSDTKFQLKVTVDKTWNLPEPYPVNIVIEITDMGDNKYLWINDIEVHVYLDVEVRLLIDEKLYSVGEQYSTTLILESNNAFKYINPGETNSYSLTVTIHGETKNQQYGWTISGWVYESFYIDVYAPPAPISITGNLPPNIVVDDTFTLQISVTNDGDYPITDVNVKLSSFLYADVIGDEFRIIERITSKDTKTASFQLKARLQGDASVTVRVSYTSVNGYEVSSYTFPFCEKEIDFTIRRKSGCLIATATYGSELSPEVQFLREFRDNKVLSTFAGSQFMNVFNSFYYSFSPSVASTIDANPLIRTVLKVCLYPLIEILHLSSEVYSVVSFSPELAIVLSGLLASSLIGIVYFSPLLFILLRIQRIQRHVLKIVKFLSVIFASSLVLLLLSETVSSSIIMMLSTGTLLLATVSLSALGVSKGITKLFEHR